MIELQDVDFAYDDHQVLKDVSLTLGKPGQNVIGLIGQNGSGKSTMFLNLVGILKPTSGRILLDGQPLKYDKKSLTHLRQKVCIVFQDSEQQLFYSIVKDDIAFALHNLKLPQDEVVARVRKVLKQLDIEHLKDRPIQYLSGGQKKRVAIAGILVLKSEWLLLDEPTAGLDPDGKQRMITLIKGLAANGQKILISSHDMDFMYEIGDYFYLLQHGNIVKQGDKKTAFADDKLLSECSLEQPWLMKLHQRLGLPLYEHADAMFEDEQLIHTLSAIQ
ncbi:energy-coupling factor ABC transporter ATP-binding protein [Furfurilactobacillus rossiae]|uniref:ABC transporter ATP-binding protein n=1 Tax=Furfurilactobacillus rossiae DSM 15814 TaxID=1114972 RepID=A0A0R1RS72_9LACO|nr:ATP-binding cassette domain-containing protein [Furfurilactobacillus rossiae]KRL56155.1 cobalt ABC transporter, ATP-binding protein [Furfurilactobacillus rossiae DSM 15814]QFR66178.1 ATP-binding cassette domain-containing protein [Furfurilactobacillus rossiae]QLE61612.1 ATPase component CbiO of energizing module of cobalt ECF transporter [Furfurilactobacillus rossiae]